MLDYASCYHPSNNALLTEHQTLLNDIIPEIAKGFYDFLLQHPDAKTFLDEEQVKTRLFHSQQHWLQTVLKPHTPQMQEEFERIQEHVGHVHARIELPLKLMNASSWLLKKLFYNALIHQRSSSQFAKLFECISDILDYATDLINQSYFAQETRIVQDSQTFALTYASSDLAYEIVQIKAQLHEWLFDIFIEYEEKGQLKPQLLEEADFHLWLEHRLMLLDNNFHSTKKVIEAHQKLRTCFNHFTAKTLNLAKLKTFREQIKSIIKNLSFTLQALSDEIAGINNHRDPLTSLQNRRLLDAVLLKEHHLAREGRNEYCLMMIDIDHFKKVNDTYGHGIGDIVLRETAQVITENLRITDLAFRYGGEEFLIVLPTTKAHNMFPIGEKIRQAIHNHAIRISEDLTLKITVSIGIACYDRHPDYTHTIKEADQALYQAKGSGRNKVVIYQGEIL